MRFVGEQSLRERIVIVFTVRGARACRRSRSKTLLRSPTSESRTVNEVESSARRALTALFLAEIDGSEWCGRTRAHCSGCSATPICRNRRTSSPLRMTWLRNRSRGWTLMGTTLPSV